MSGRRRRPADRGRTPWTAIILVGGLNVALYARLRSSTQAAALDRARRAGAAWRERALAAEEAVALLAARPAAGGRAAAAAPAAALEPLVRAPPAPPAVPRWSDAARRAAPRGAPPHAKAAPAATLPRFYGDGPRTVGLETCAAYRAARKPHQYRWAPAGMFNCGTNTLLNLMQLNCVFDRVGRHGFWQAPWGKHNPLSWRGKHWAPQFQGKAFRPDPLSVFPVVVVKDPATWMKSMCRNQYEARFRHHPNHRTERCPSPVADTGVTMRYQPDRPSFYQTLPHFWRDWYREYANSTHPRLLIRFEDLLFDSERTVRTVCECVGGTMLHRFTQETGVSKDKTLGHYGPVNDRNKALRLYGSEAKRFAHYDREDLELMRRVAGSIPLFRDLAYDFDVDAALEAGAHDDLGRRRLLFNASRPRARTRPRAGWPRPG